MNETPSDRQMEALHVSTTDTTGGRYGPPASAEGSSDMASLYHPTVRRHQQAPVLVSLQLSASPAPHLYFLFPGQCTRVPEGCGQQEGKQEVWGWGEHTGGRDRRGGAVRLLPQVAALVALLCGSSTTLGTY